MDAPQPSHHRLVQESALPIFLVLTISLRGGIDNQKVTSMKSLINSDVDGLSRTIRAGYYKAGFANYIHKDGRAANTVLIIKKL